MKYNDDYTREISFPLGGIGTGRFSTFQTCGI